VRPCFVIVLAYVGAGCTPTVEQALAENRANADTFRRALESVAQAVETAPPPAESAHCKPARPLSFSPNGAGHDTEVYVFEDLRGGGIPATERPKIDLSQKTPMHTLLADTHPTRVWSPAERSQKITSEVLEAYRRAALVKSVVVLKQRSHERDRGLLMLDYFVVDFDKAHIQCAGNVAARANPDLGQRAYDVIGNDDAGVRRVLASGQTDLYWDRMQLDAYKKLEERFRDDLVMDLQKP
jgi:hypothetical protein